MRPLQNPITRWIEATRATDPLEQYKRCPKCFARMIFTCVRTEKPRPTGASGWVITAKCSNALCGELRLVDEAGHECALADVTSWLGGKIHEQRHL